MINTDWKFHKGKIKDAYAFELDDREWENVSIPHTWNNIDGQDGTVGGKSIKETDYFRSDCWYRKQIFIDNEDKDKQIFLRFQGANIQIELFPSEHIKAAIPPSVLILRSWSWKEKIISASMPEMIP